MLRDWVDVLERSVSGAILIDRSCQAVRNFAGLIEQYIMQPCQVRNRPRTAEFTCIARKRVAVHRDPIPHRPRIIVVLVYPVKTQCRQQTVA